MDRPPPPAPVLRHGATARPDDTAPVVPAAPFLGAGAVAARPDRPPPSSPPGPAAHPPVLPAGAAPGAGGPGGHGAVQPRAGWGGRPVPDLPRRPGMAALAAVVLVAVAAVSPLGAAVLTLLWAGLARAVQWSRIAVARVRWRDGRVGAGAWTGQVFAYPFRLVGALATSVGYVLLGVLMLSPLLLVGAAVLLEVQGVPWSNGTAVQGTLTDPLVLGGAAVLAGLVAWWGPGGRAVREGSRALTEPVLRHRNGRLVAAGLAALVAVASLLVVSRLV